MKLPIAYYGNPILRKKGKPVKAFDESLKKLVEDMIETMESSDGVGIAAQQIHKALLLFITKAPSYDEEKNDWVEGEIRIFVNAKIIKKSPEVWDFDEGCLSIPKVYDKVPRHWTITLAYQDIEGNSHVEEFTGYPARVVQHEFDHTQGILFVDRVLGKARQALEPKLKEIKQKYSKS
ncbi:MAG: peptide deformylase [Chlamydiales bacterium]